MSPSTPILLHQCYLAIDGSRAGTARVSFGAMRVMRIAAGNICGGRIARGGALAPPSCYPPDFSASAYKPQEIPSEVTSVLARRKVKSLVDDAPSLIASCKADRRELTGSWYSNDAIVSHEADECAARQGTGKEKRVTSIGKLVTTDNRSVRRIR